MSALSRTVAMIYTSSGSAARLCLATGPHRNLSHKCLPQVKKQPIDILHNCCVRTQVRHVHAKAKSAEHSEHHADDEVHHEQPATGTVTQQPLSFIEKAKIMGANAVCIMLTVLATFVACFNSWESGLSSPGAF